MVQRISFNLSASTSSAKDNATPVEDSIPNKTLDGRVETDSISNGTCRSVDSTAAIQFLSALQRDKLDRADKLVDRSTTELFALVARKLALDVVASTSTTDKSARRMLPLTPRRNHITVTRCQSARSSSLTKHLPHMNFARKSNEI